MKVAIAIETKDRRIADETLPAPSRPVNYLGATLANLARSGAFASPFLHSVQVTSGGELPDFFEREIIGVPYSFDPLRGESRVVHVHPCPTSGRTRQQNGAAAIRVAAETHADFVVKLEDDLDFCDDFVGSVARWLAKHADADVRMFALAMAFETYPDARYKVLGESVLGPGKSFPWVRKRIAEGRDFWRHSVKDAGGFWGAQALAFRRDDARQLVAWLGDDPAYGSIRNAAHDFALGQWAEFVGAALPSFVQHLGEQSSINLGRFFQFPWPGREWRYQ